jgi:hypothetical protein
MSLISFCQPAPQARSSALAPQRFRAGNHAAAVGRLEYARDVMPGFRLWFGSRSSHEEHRKDRAAERQ